MSEDIKPRLFEMQNAAIDLAKKLAAAEKQNETPRMLLAATQGHRDAAAKALAAAEERAENFDRQLFGIATVLEPLARHSNLTEAARDLVARLLAAEADRDALLAEIQKWREGRAYLGVPMTYVDQRLVDETRASIGNKRAAGVKHG